MSKKSIAALGAVVLAVLAGSAMAQGYVGVAGGPSRLSSDCTGTIACDKTGTGFKVYGGYRMTPAVAIEVAYLDFGKATAAADIFGTRVDAQIKSSGFGAGVAAIGEIAPDWSVAGRIGVAQIRARISGSAGGASASDTDTTTQAYYGFDIGYALSKSAVLTLGADASRSAFQGERGTVRMFNVGARFAF